MPVRHADEELQLADGSRRYLDPAVRPRLNNVVHRGCWVKGELGGAGRGGGVWASAVLWHEQILEVQVEDAVQARLPAQLCGRKRDRWCGHRRWWWLLPVASWTS